MKRKDLSSKEKKPKAVTDATKLKVRKATLKDLDDSSLDRAQGGKCGTVACTGN